MNDVTYSSDYKVSSGMMISENLKRKFVERSECVLIVKTASTRMAALEFAKKNVRSWDLLNVKGRCLPLTIMFKWPVNIL